MDFFTVAAVAWSTHRVMHWAEGLSIRMFLRNIPHEPTGGGGTRATDKDDKRRVLRVCEITIWLGEARPRALFISVRLDARLSVRMSDPRRRISVVTSGSRCIAAATAPFSRTRDQIASLCLFFAHPITLRRTCRTQLSPRVCTPARDRTWVLYVPDVSSESEGRFHQRRVTLTLA